MLTMTNRPMATARNRAATRMQAVTIHGNQMRPERTNVMTTIVAIKATNRKRDRHRRDKDKKKSVAVSVFEILIKLLEYIEINMNLCDAWAYNLT